MLNVGSLVKLRKEWCESIEEGNIVYMVVNVNEHTKRYIIEAQVNTALKPQEIVGFDMVEAFEE